MSDPTLFTSPGDEVSLTIAASPAHLYALVTDPTAMGRLSPECTGGAWLDGATGPAVGARFKGTNKRGKARWSTMNTVVAAEPDARFALETKQSGTRWIYEFRPDGDGTLVTESREPFKPRPLVARVYAKLMLGGGPEHEDELRQGMLHTLERLRDVAERSTST